MFLIIKMPCIIILVVLELKLTKVYVFLYVAFEILVMYGMTEVLCLRLSGWHVDIFPTLQFGRNRSFCSYSNFLKILCFKG